MKCVPRETKEFEYFYLTKDNYGKFLEKFMVIIIMMII